MSRKEESWSIARQPSPIKVIQGLRRVTYCTARTLIDIVKGPLDGIDLVVYIRELVIQQCPLRRQRSTSHMGRLEILRKAALREANCEGQERKKP